LDVLADGVVKKPTLAQFIDCLNQSINSNAENFSAQVAFAASYNNAQLSLLASQLIALSLRYRRVDTDIKLSYVKEIERDLIQEVLTIATGSKPQAIVQMLQRLYEKLTEQTQQNQGYKAKMAALTSAERAARFVEDFEDPTEVSIKLL
jgi:hypothetical protein